MPTPIVATRPVMARPPLGGVDSPRPRGPRGPIVSRPRRPAVDSPLDALPPRMVPSTDRPYPEPPESAPVPRGPDLADDDDDLAARRRPVLSRPAVASPGAGNSIMADQGSGAGPARRGSGGRCRFTNSASPARCRGRPSRSTSWPTRPRPSSSPRRTRNYLAGGARWQRTRCGPTATPSRRWRIVPRFLRDVDRRDLSVEVLGHRLPAPVLLAPIGVQSILHKHAELAVARAALDLGWPMVLSTVSSETMEDVAKELGDSPRWFQLYWPRSDDLTASFVARAEAAGYSATWS